jgi:ATP-dependent protease HslVU (ClpYQ) peptidase subunit
MAALRSFAGGTNDARALQDALERSLDALGRCGLLKAEA